MQFVEKITKIYQNYEYNRCFLYEKNLNKKKNWTKINLNTQKILHFRRIIHTDAFFLVMMADYTTKYDNF